MIVEKTGIAEVKEYKLTQYSKGSGCSCKIAPQVLEEILHTTMKEGNFPQLLVGNASRDDAAVYDLGNGTALVSTTDFFNPIVDDAFDFGRIASANAISDVYAMGGKPLMAISILGWPTEKIPAEIAQKVLDGSRQICAEAGIPLAGGHSIDSPEPIFGLSVTGIIPIRNLKKNNTAGAGDVLILTKPIGTGILSSALKRGVLIEEHYPALLKNMTTLNKIGESLGRMPEVTAITDITGFGLAGHLLEMVEKSGLSADLYYSRLPLIVGVQEYLSQRIVPDATYRNWNSISDKVGFEKGVNVMEAFSILPDPQTNGGLLIAVKEESAEQIISLCAANGIVPVIIGKLLPAQKK